MYQALYQTPQICCLSFRSHDHPLKLVLLLSHCSESQKDLEALLGGGVYDSSEGYATSVGWIHVIVALS